MAFIINILRLRLGQWTFGEQHIAEQIRLVERGNAKSGWFKLTQQCCLMGASANSIGLALCAPPSAKAA